MADEPEPRTLEQSDWDEVARFIRDEKERRANTPRRMVLEATWREIDRQIAMTAIPRQIVSGQRADWYPAVELPMQFTAHEVIASDARRLKFPRGSEWYSALANVSDDYMERWMEQRAAMPMIGDTAQPMKLDQETADTIVKAVIDHFHQLYDFRGAIDLFDGEMIKYGTGIVRVRNVRTPKLTAMYRGMGTASTGPMVIPGSIRQTYLDDTPSAVMLEGIRTGPMHIRQYFQRINDLAHAAKVGGSDKGWRTAQIADLKPLNEDEKKGLVEMLEAEGDVIVSRSQAESIYLPNVQILVAVGGNGARVVRFQENQTPFNSYVIGHYMRDDVQSPYGVSPLMSGQPLQEAASSVLNDLLAAAMLNGKPPIVWDRNDPHLTALGGPVAFPGAQIGVEDTDSIKDLQIGDLQGLANAYLVLVKQYEDTTGVNDPRRGAQVNSHTTATAIDIEATRGQARTQDFVESVEQGPLTTILYMEYELAKQALGKAQDIAVEMGGVEGWIRLSKKDLPDECVFRVHGSSGVLNERQRAENFIQAAKFATEAAQLGVALGQPVSIDLNSMLMEGFLRYGIPNAGRFVGNSQPAAPGTMVSSSVQGAAAALPPNAIAGMAPSQVNGSGGGGQAGAPPAV